MESGPAANSVLVSPLAVDDVFRHRTVPEVQELLRQLQLQQANDVEELRSLIGVRYLSFLEGLPEITRMQQSAEDALEDARAFGTGLRRLANALGNAVSEVGEQQSREHQQLCLEEELPLQNSTPLDDFLFSCEVDASTPAVYFPPRKGHRAEPAPRFRVYPCLSERHAALQGQAEPLRYLQQQLLVLPSRVWEAARCQKFLEALRLIHIEGTRQAAAARAAVRELQQQHQQGLKPAQQNIERLISGCLALAQQLIEKLKGRGTRWQLPTGPLFWVGGAPPSHSDISSTSSHDWVPCDKPLCNATLELLDALGKSCSNTCICMSERRVRELPLLSCRTLNDGMSGASTPLKAEDERSQNAFEEDLRRHLVDIAYLFGRVEDPQELRAALPLRAAIAASFLQSLSECTTPLVGRASATVATAVDAQPSDGCTRDKDAYAALVLDARRVEWLFVAYREAETLPKHDNSVVSTEVASVPEQAREDSGEADCRRKFASFLAEWISWDSQRQDISEVHLVQPSNGDRAEGGNNAETAQVVATARAAAQSLLPNLCCSSFVGYAVGFWPFVRTKVEELQKSWQWHKTASATPAAEAGVSTIDISGGAMSFLLELSRHLIAVSRSLK
ncbi:uncharacterized protein EMH_0032120 [Eimeria mitis]|uniref:Uncharacterized protein n=1 Tax=Eimeria mitis TaxID=44415 RepID=U6JVD4_9EIME|nr:uncharacterized protein EMH_0032120 [Eimeria mitis]CDJ27478.1 hypothetical protein, conserved [Eimeria mitis]